MKFVRWLGALRRSADMLASARWEVSQNTRQIAVEPLYKGQSLLYKGVIGLAVDHEQSQFVQGICHDAYTRIMENGTLKVTRLWAKEKYGHYKNIDRFLKAWNAGEWTHHGEVILDCVQYNAVVVKNTATKEQKALALKIALELNLPLKKVAAFRF